jgi:DNA-binding transcriptional MerR regulator
MTSGVNERPYLSIGEVLGLLLEEFPDVTISKIRFLESQGLIEPERTSSGYRKFFDPDIERLRVILREQRENFLPLRVIRDRLETGEIDDSGSIPIPVQQTPVPTPNNVSPIHRGARQALASIDLDGDDPTGTISRDAHLVQTNRHPAAQGRSKPVEELRGAVERSDVYSADELCEATGVSMEQLRDLESFGLVTPRRAGSAHSYSTSDVAIVRAASGFLARGIDARHLRSWKQAAEREAGLYEQRILPLLRQRNPQARGDAAHLLEELAGLGSDLRQAFIVSMLRQHLDP